jgi:murein DD-endopeptidase MepM/ murein hydrolase activator NlpD
LSCYPVAKHEGRVPVVTQGFRYPGHLGVDIMFKRLPGELGGGSHPLYTVPLGAVVLAPAPGVVVYAKPHSNGFRVRLDHGGVHTVHLHLKLLCVVAGEQVSEGLLGGPIGADPTDSEGLPHLHFETRWTRGWRDNTATDGWGMVPISPGELFGWPWPAIEAVQR